MADDPLIIQALLEHGASRDATLKIEPDTDLQPRDDWTEIHSAANFGHLEAVGLLLMKGCEASRPDSNGRTPLHLASRNGYVEVVQALLRNHAYAYIDGADNHGCTALHLASEAGCAAVVRLLLGYGADPTLINKEGQSVITIAAMRGRSAITILLLDQKRISRHARNADRFIRQLLISPSPRYLRSPQVIERVEVQEAKAETCPVEKSPLNPSQSHAIQSSPTYNPKLRTQPKTESKP
ncbi:unnamed protein product, partial [Sphagnum balticum]